MIITRKEKEYNSKNNLIPEKAVREKYFGLWNISQMQRIKQQWLRVDWVQPYLWPPQQPALPDLEQEQSTDLYHKHISWSYNKAAFMEKLGNKNVIRNENPSLYLAISMIDIHSPGSKSWSAFPDKQWPAKRCSFPCFFSLHMCS